MAKFKTIGSNVSESESKKVVVLVSYATPVAAWVSGEGCLRSSQRFSSTTSSQVKKWLSGKYEKSAVRGQCQGSATEVPQGRLDTLAQRNESLDGLGRRGRTTRRRKACPVGKHRVTRGRRKGRCVR